MKNLLLTIASTLGMTAITMAQSVPNYVPANGLVGWWPFTGNANDESGNGNHAVANAALLTSDRAGNANTAYSFNGSNAYLHGNASTFPSGDRTIALWFYTTNINVGTAGMQVFGYGGGLCGRSWLMQIDNSTPFTSFFTDNSYEVSIGCNNWLTALPFGVNGSPANPNNNWHHWVITNGTGGIDYYFDGNYAGGITTPTGNTLVAGKMFFMGSCPDSTGLVAYQDAYLNNWNGKLDDIGVWNRQLTQQEITALYNAGTVGLTDLHQPISFSVYPNPAQNIINLKVNQEYLGLPVKLFDNYGKLVLTKIIDQTNFSLDLINLANGIYLLRMEDNKGSNFKFVKQ
ncbi:MAG: LamG-like jellyroll fold domain-containing protein [Candidatus Methylopumilus sp.]